MKSNNLLAILIVAVLAGCGGGGGGNNNGNNNGSNNASSGGGTGTGPASTFSTGTANELTVTVNGALADPATTVTATNVYFNKPAVAVTVCQPGTTNCHTISDILLDTGSYGLRIFASALPSSVPLTPVTVGSNLVGECVQFADLSSSWGQVMIADVSLAEEPSVRVPIHVINAGFGSSSVCGNPDATPQQAGFHGILGVGIFAQDCGSACEQDANNGMYFVCSGSSCSPSKVPVASQVQNPVTALPQDNNGVLVQLPGVPPGGAPSVDGKVIFGIGTRGNNIPSGVTKYDVAATGGQFPFFLTTLNGTTYHSFLDTGSNANFMPSGANLFPICTNLAPWFCPATTTTVNVTNQSASGSVSTPYSFNVANASSLFSSTNRVFNDLAGSSGTNVDFGLPFFLGRDVFVGFKDKTSTLGTGPYWAY